MVEKLIEIQHCGSLLSLYCIASYLAVYGLLRQFELERPDKFDANGREIAAKLFLLSPLTVWVFIAASFWRLFNRTAPTIEAFLYPPIRKDDEAESPEEPETSGHKAREEEDAPQA